MSGWFAVKRGALTHDLFAPTGPYSKFEAWVWMIENTPFKDGEVTVKGKIYPTKRGHLYHSIRFMAGKFRWTEKAVRVFISKLEEAGAVQKIGAQRGAQFGAQLRICNYEKYQSAGHSEGHTKGHKEEQGLTIPVGAVDKSTPPDPAKVMFDSGISLLTRAGKSEQAARSLIGKWKSKAGVAATIEAISRAVREDAAEPVAFIEGCIKWQSKGPRLAVDKTYAEEKAELERRLIWGV